VFSKNRRVATVLCVAAAFAAISNYAFASGDPGPTPGPLVPLVPSSEPTPPRPPPTITPSPLPTLPPQGPTPEPRVPPEVERLVRLGPSATIVLPNATSAVTRCVDGVFQLVSLPQDQLAQVIVQYPTSQAAEIVKIEAVDGGLLAASVTTTAGGYTVAHTVTVPSKRVDTGTISANGTLTFLFQTGHPPGLYQIRIQRATQVLGLQFWIEDPQHPANNPPAMRPVTGAPTQPPI
jgi:hypothetical protein